MLCPCTVYAAPLRVSMQYSARAPTASCHVMAWPLPPSPDPASPDPASPDPASPDPAAGLAGSLQVLAEDGIALRGLFIIDKEGTVQHSTINNLGFGRSVDETKRVLQAIQYIQSNPDEVCPAGWK